MNWIKNYFSIIVITIVLFEFISFLITKMEFFLINETPIFYVDSKNKQFQDIAYGRTEREAWGAWHVANKTFRHSKYNYAQQVCFDVLMEFNEIGARDESFVNLKNNNIFLLGDSFAEGYGVSLKDTSQFFIEKKMGLSVSNFGASGNFGPLQELLIYKKYRNLPHQGLIVYVLPSNDFTDNDINLWLNKQHRYRPYFSPEPNPLIPFYFSNAIKKDDPFIVNKDLNLKQFIKEHFWSSNALRTFLMILRKDATREDIAQNNNLIKSYFYDANSTQQNNLIIAYEAILDLAEQRDVLFVIIPSKTDISRSQMESEPNNYKQQAWYQGFKSFENRQQNRVSVLNLMDHLPSETEYLFFNCDQHWGPKGNRWAADVITNHIKAKKLFNSFIK